MDGRVRPALEATMRRLKRSPGPAGGRETGAHVEAAGRRNRRDNGSTTHHRSPTRRQRFSLFRARHLDDDALFARWRSLRQDDFPDLALARAGEFAGRDWAAQVNPTCPYCSALLRARVRA